MIIIEFIISIIVGIIVFTSEAFSSISRAFGKFRVRRKIDKRYQEAKQGAQKYLNFTSYDELPADGRVLEALLQHCQEELDSQRVFLILKKFYELNTGFYSKHIYELAMRCRKGIGTERSDALASQAQARYFMYQFRNYGDYWHSYGKYKKWLTDPKYFYDPEGLLSAAEGVINNGNYEGILLLQEAIIALELGLKMDAAVEERIAAYNTIPDHPSAIYYLWLYGDQKDTAPLIRAAELGCWMAAAELKDKDILENIEKQYTARMNKSMESIRESCSLKLSDAKRAKILFEDGLEEYKTEAAGLDNKGWIKINEAIALGNRKAALWACRTRAELGDPAAEYQFAQYLLEGREGFAQDIDRAILLLMRSAGKNHPQAQYQWGDILMQGAHNVPSDPELALSFFKRAAQQGHKRAALRLGLWYTEADHLDAGQANVYLLPLTNEEDKYLCRNASYGLMKLYWGNEIHCDVFPELEDAFLFAFKVATIDFENTNDKLVREAISYYRETLHSARYCHYLAVEYRSRVLHTGDAALVPLSEIFTLQQIHLTIPRALEGDTKAMIDLNEEYCNIGFWRLTPFKGNVNHSIIEFVGNHKKADYWLKKAVSLGSINAMYILGDEWKHWGISEEEGQYWMREAASLGHRGAQETLAFDAQQAAEAAIWDHYVHDYRKSMQQSLLNQEAAFRAERENINAPLHIDSVPEVITGPNGKTYHRTGIDPFSAEYTNEFGETIVIEDRDIGATGAKTKDGYFHW